MKIKFDVDGKPPRKGDWGETNVLRIVELRKKALDAREKINLTRAYDNAIKLNVVIYAPNILKKDGYKQNGNYDSKRFVGDLDSYVDGICDHIHTTQKEKDSLPDIFKVETNISPIIPLIINDDSQIVEISAKKEENKDLKYSVEIIFLDENLKELD